MKNAPLARRIFAFLIDYILLGIFGMILGAFFFDFFYKLDFYGVFLGLAVYVLYFGVLNSRAGKGQTPGKKMLKIKTVDAGGNFLSPEKSFLRALVLYLPITILSLNAPVTSSLFLTISIVYALAISFCVATAYLLLFNKPSRQGAHDLIAKSFVVRAAETPVSGFNRKTSASVIFAACAAVLILFTAVMSYNSFIGGLLKSAKTVYDKYGLNVQQITIGYRKNLNTGKTSSNASIVIRKYLNDDEALAKDIAQTLYDINPNVRRTDFITVIFIKNYNIGIATAQTKFIYNYPVAK